MDFRKDINGLRAYAVVGVLLYHFGVLGFSGGFAGVDVFYVISGYLMTSIIIGGLESGSFTLSGFYLGRARRILPALIGLCLVMLVFGWFWLIPVTYSKLAENVAASVLFYSNMAYMNVGYFDAPAHENWLLHTWSLSVEWQFYLAYPLVLLAVARHFKATRLHFQLALWLLLLVSLVACVAVTKSNPSAAFYLLPLRGWELLAGGIVALSRPNLVVGARVTAGLEWLGIVMILGAFLFFDSNMAWPGYQAILPVLGTSLVILAGRQNSIWTGNPLAQYLGKWSYSIYLWHWPLVVGLDYFGLQGNINWLPLALTMSMVLGALSYVLIEQSARHYLQAQPRRVGWKFIAATAAVPVLVSVWIIVDDGIPRSYRLSPPVLQAAYEKINTSRLDECKKTKNVDHLPECVIGDGQVKVVVWGDSHAGSTVTAVAEAARKQGGSVRLFLRPGCPTLIDAPGLQNAICEKFNQQAWAEVQKIDHQVPLVIVSRLPAYLADTQAAKRVIADLSGQVDTASPNLAASLVDSLCQAAHDRPVYVVRPIPDVEVDVPTVMARSLMLSGKATDVALDFFEYQRISEMANSVLESGKRQCGIQLLDPAPYLCSEGKCFGSIKGRPLYSDANHLSEYGNRYLIPMFEEVFRSGR